MKKIFPILGIATALFLVATGGAYLAFGAADCSAGGCSGAVNVDGSGNISIGTTTFPGNVRLYAVGSSSDSSYFGLSVQDSTGSGPLLLVRNDGRVDIATSTFSTNGALRVVGQIETASTTGIPGGIVFPDGSIQTIAASAGDGSAGNVSPGTFGSIVGVGNYAFPAALTVSSTLTVGTTTAPAAGVSFFNGRVGIGTNNPTSTLDVSGGAIIVRNSVAPRGAIASSERLRFTGPSSDALLAFQDGTGRVNWYWNSTPGTTPAYLVGGENAGRMFFGIADNVNLLTLSYASGAGQSAGTSITWSNEFAVATSGLVTASGRITGVSTPTASTDVATKAYVDSAFATSSITWAGYTTTTYTGNPGGDKAVVNDCQNSYPGSVPMNPDDLIRLGSQYPWTSDAWLYLGGSVGGSGLLTCNDWTSNSSGVQGVILSATAGTINPAQTCNISAKFGCVYKHWVQGY